MNSDELYKADEEKRLAYIRSLNILDTPIEDCFERVSRLIKAVIDAPIVGFSVVGKNREWFKSILGSDLTEVPRETSFGNYIVQQKEASIIPNVNNDDRFKGNPLINGGTNINSYLGVPLFLSQYCIGTLFVCDTKPRNYTDSDVQLLEDLGKTATNELRARQLKDILKD